MVKRIRNWFKHKLKHISIDNIKRLLKENGMAFVVIFIIWEVIEDILFPVLFYWLGNNVNPWFHTAIPISFIVCLHGIMVPLTWTIWIKFRRKKVKEDDDGKPVGDGTTVCSRTGS